MAVTVTTVAGPFVIGDRKQVVFNIAADASHLAAGEAVSIAQLGFSTSVDLVMIEPAAGYTFEYDHAAFKVVAYYADYDAVADGPLVAVPDETDLVGVTNIRGFAIGR